MIEIMVRIPAESEKEFLELKKSLGLTANTEVVNYALRQCYKYHGVKKHAED